MRKSLKPHKLTQYLEISIVIAPATNEVSEEAVIASRVDIGLESRNFVVVAFVVAQAYP